MSTDSSNVADRTPDARERHPVGGPLEDDPRGGWRFQDPQQRAERGADTRSPEPVRTHVDPYQLDVPADRERRHFIGNAQYPPHSYPRSGTQGTWDESLGSAGRPPEPEPKAAAAAQRPAEADL